MKRRLLVLCTAAVTALGLAAVAWADSPHWNSYSDSISSNGYLTCSFKEVGLGTISSTSITCTADATATYYCVNGGNNHPKAANKETTTEPVSGGGNYPVRNGQTTGDITVAPPGPGDFSCPGGQRLVLGDVSYTNVVLHGEAGDQPLADRSITLVSF
jgi:hypothetical protein